MEMYVRRDTSGVFLLIVPFITEYFSVHTKALTIFFFREG
jgi:hypothetical protein